ncbi:phosphoglycerate mutase family protein [Bombilactobacillus bombi]|uniref:phosphoglycerate mutase family protein n=1 Tax=Bombilactobacillus bombi TaxID=1303590 RepID=UPI000E579DCF|nr:phosphoglycerate mutase family protein [Bombilactobacillus bombi]AXX65077.1 phosphoglycerate mutase family protein [Bombilactobacillus bombi]
MFSGEAWYMILFPYGIRSYEEASKKVGLDKIKDFTKKSDPFHNAENSKEFWQRIDNGFNKLDNLVNNGDKILLVSHGGTIESIASKYGNSLYTNRADNLSLTKIKRKKKKINVTNYNINLTNDEPYYDN